MQGIGNECKEILGEIGGLKSGFHDCGAKLFRKGNYIKRADARLGKFCKLTVDLLLCYRRIPCPCIGGMILGTGIFKNFR